MISTDIRAIALTCALISTVVVADQLTKHLARRHLTTDRFDAIHADFPACTADDRERERKRLIRSHGRPEPIIPMFFSLRYVENCGSSFNVLLKAPEWFRYPLFIITSLLAIGVSAVLLVKRKPRGSTALGWALFLGGTAGNLIDRLTHRYVIDFLDFYLVLGRDVRSWPTFNVADIAIAAGALLIAADLWRAMSPKASTRAASSNGV